MAIMDDNLAETITAHDIDDLFLDNSPQARERLLAIFSNPQNRPRQLAFSDVGFGAEVSEARVYECSFPKLLNFPEGGEQKRHIVVLTLGANSAQRVFKGAEVTELIQDSRRGKMSLDTRKYPKLSTHQVESLELALQPATSIEFP